MADDKPQLQIRIKRINGAVHISMVVGDGPLHVYRQHTDGHWSMVRSQKFPPVRIARGDATSILDALSARYEQTEKDHIGMADGTKEYTDGADSTD